MFEEKWECGLRCWSVSGRLLVPFDQQLLNTASFSSDPGEAGGCPGWGLGWGLGSFHPWERHHPQESHTPSGTTALCLRPQEACWVTLCLLHYPWLAGCTLRLGSELWDVQAVLSLLCAHVLLFVPRACYLDQRHAPSNGCSRRRGPSPWGPGVSAGSKGMPGKEGQLTRGRVSHPWFGGKFLAFPYFVIGIFSFLLMATVVLPLFQAMLPRPVSCPGRAGEALSRGRKKLCSSTGLPRTVGLFPQPCCTTGGPTPPGEASSPGRAVTPRKVITPGKVITPSTVRFFLFRTQRAKHTCSVCTETAAH